MAEWIWSRTYDALGHDVWCRRRLDWQTTVPEGAAVISVSAGRGNWRWAAWPDYRASLYSEVPFASGASPTRERAALDALAHVQVDLATEGPASAVGRYLHRLAVERRMSRVSRSTSSQPRELVFDYCEQAHLVIRKTARFVYASRDPLHFVEPRGGHSEPSWLDHDVPTVRLDRTDLEQGCSRGYWTEAGLAERRARHAEAYGPPPECLVMLGLSLPCTQADVRRAYRRLVKEAHPDGGGTAQGFIALRAAYQRALAFVPPDEQAEQVGGGA